MTLSCCDQSGGKLFLAVDFLSFLTRYAETVQIFCAKDEREQYRGLARIFPGLLFTSKTSEHYDLLFTDTVITAPSADLVYLFAGENPPADLGGNYIPHSSRNQFTEYTLPDLPSAQDMIKRLKTKQDLQGKRILISAGPTAEDIDPVRYLTNRSSGKMGIALARAAFIRGAKTELILGPAKQQPPLVLHTTFVRSAAEMADAVQEKFADTDVYIGSAAIADYTPQKIERQKIKKQKNGWQLKLKRTTDVLRTLAKKHKRQIVIGFSVETNNIIANSLKKLEQKQLDMIVINNPNEQGSGFAVDTNKVSVLLKNGQMYNLPLQSKQELSYKILDFLREIEAQHA